MFLQSTQCQWVSQGQDGPDAVKDWSPGPRASVWRGKGMGTRQVVRQDRVGQQT